MGSGLHGVDLSPYHKFQEIVIHTMTTSIGVFFDHFVYQTVPMLMLKVEAGIRDTANRSD